MILLSSAKVGIFSNMTGIDKKGRLSLAFVNNKMCSFMAYLELIC